MRFWLNDSCRDNLLDHLENEDLASIRLVCHDFSSRAAPRLFESITSTFKTSTFSKPARIEALSRVGRHVKTFTFHMPHSSDTFLPPIVDPMTGEEKKFNYEPQLQNSQNCPGKDKTPKYGSWEMQDLLVKQYPPLFHGRIGGTARWDHVCTSCSSPTVMPWKRWLGEKDWRSAFEASRV